MKINFYTLHKWVMPVLVLLIFQATAFSQQVAKTIPSSSAANGIIGFLEFRPSDYGTQKHPLIIFLHGIGERGNGTSDINLVTANAVPRFCANGATMRFTVGGQTSSFVVLSPQLYTGYQSWPGFYVQEMMKYAKANLQIDTNRIYVTGLSLGGGGVWRAISNSLTDDYQIAAAAPVCGIQDMNDALYCSTVGTSHMPVWAFHCMDDGTVPVQVTMHAQALGNACTPAMSPASIFTYYLTGGHSGAWINAFDTGHITTVVNGGGTFTANPNLYEWLLSNSRSSTAPNQPPIANAGVNQTITLPVSTANLSGTGTGVNGATITTYQWSQTSGPSTATFSSGNAASTAVTGLVQGIYVFKLTVTDNHGLTASASVSITVNAAGNLPPTANAGSSQTITLPTNSVNLTGTGTGNNGATITAYQWSQTSGPSTATFSSANAANTSASGLVQGVYVFMLMVTDNNGLTASASVSISVNAAGNVPPTANAGNNQSINLPANTVNLNGSGTGNNGATISAYQWVQTSGPSTATIATAGSASTSVSGLVQGNYVFTLTVTDNNGLTGSSSVSVTVNAAANQPPSAFAGGSQFITLPVSTVTLSGSGTGNNGATISSYQWIQVGGPLTAVISTPASASSVVTGLSQAGIYMFTIIVTDNHGLSSSASVLITVNASPNTPPTANAGVSQSISLPLNTATLTGTGTGTNGATISSYQWVQSSGPSTATIGTAAAASTTVSGLVQGNYVFTLTVTDNHGLSASASVSIIVNAAASQPPSASAGGSQSITLPVSTVTLSGSGTGNGGASIVSYQWMQVGGPVTASINTAGAASTTVSGLSLPGTYTFTIIVTDNNGLSSSASVVITVNAAANTPPTANAGGSQSISLPVNSVTLTGTGTGTNGATISSYQWVQTSGPSTATIATAAAASTTVSGLVQGNYVFTLTVTDNHGLSSNASVVITVNAAANQPPTANAGGNQSITLPLNTVGLSGTGSGNGGATIVSYLWSQSSGPATATIGTATAASTTVSGLVQGNYVFTLTVTDNHGLSSSASVSITVNAAANQPPVANAGADISIALPINSVVFDGTQSYDPDGTIAGYSWNKLSGPGATTIVNSNTATASAIGLTAGVYVFELTVTDNQGATARDQVVVTVDSSGTANAVPIADAGKDTSITLPSSSVVLSGINSREAGGSIVYYGWKQLTGPSAVQLSDSNAAVTTALGLVEGVYEFMLTVKDNAGATGEAMVKVTVINSLRNSTLFKLYPNPATGILHVQFIDDKTGKLSITAYDAMGKLVLQQVLNKDQSLLNKDLNVVNLKPGMYYLEILQADGQKMVRPFVKQ